MSSHLPLRGALAPLTMPGRALPSPLLTGLVSYWKLDETSGTRVDSHGSNNLTDNNTVTQAVGKVGSSAQFTAANSESLSILDNVSISVGDIDFTVACWVYMDTKPGNQMGIAGQFLVAGNQRSWLLFWINGTDNFQFAVSNDGTATTTVTASAFGGPATLNWYLIVVWHDSVANTINIQINDGTVNSASHTTGVLDSSAPFRLGVRDQAGVDRFWNGRIDEAGFWKKVLTPAERTQLYNSGNGVTYPAFS